MKDIALAGVAQSQAWEAKGHWFDSQSGHMPGMRARWQPIDVSLTH